MIRARFRANYPDYRPVKWPVPHPYWCSGSAGDDSYAIVIAYADDLAQVLELWPEATHVEAEEVDGYEFSDRFPRPKWFAGDSAGGEPS